MNNFLIKSKLEDDQFKLLARIFFFCNVLLFFKSNIFLYPSLLVSQIICLFYIILFWNGEWYYNN